MLVLVGKATPNDENRDVELFLGEFRRMLNENGLFVYAWSFNPRDFAVNELHDSLGRREDVFLYLPCDGQNSQIRLHIKDFRHFPAGTRSCPTEWLSYCIPDLQDLPWQAHTWFLIDGIEDLAVPVMLLEEFEPVFPNKYVKWGQNYFAFLRGNP